MSDKSYQHSEKENTLPKNPLKRNTDGDGEYTCSVLRPRAYAHRRARAEKKSQTDLRILKWQDRLFAAGIVDPVPSAVREAVEVCGGTEDDYRQWMKIANRNFNSFIGVLMEFEYELEKPDGNTLRNRPAAFQSRLNRVLPKNKE